MSNFEIVSFKSTDFRVLLSNLIEIQFTSRVSTSEKYCLDLIDSIKTYSIYDKAFETRQLECGSWYFILLNLHTKTVLGSSKTYASKFIVEQKLKEFKRIIQKAENKNKHKVLKLC